MPDPVIECRGLRHSYGRRQVLFDLDFDVPPGRILGLLGKNGAGKTTTINILMGFLEPTGGECRVFGEPSHRISPKTRRRIGLLHEGHLQYEFMTVRQVERFHAAFYPRWKRERFEDLMDRMEMPRGRRISRMSCGQRSQVALGLILAQDPDLLILDDYSMGLDAGYRRLFLDFLKDFAREHGRAVLLTSHIVQDLERLVDDVLILDRGRVLVQTTLAEFAKSLREYTFTLPAAAPPIAADEVIRNSDVVGRTARVYSFDDLETVRSRLADRGLDAGGLEETPITLEDAFIGLTGKY